MEELTSMGIISIIPAILAIVLSFATKNTIVALAVACIAGTTMSGIVMGDSLVDTLLLGFPTLLKENLGTTSFSGVMLLNTLIGILAAYLTAEATAQGLGSCILGWLDDKALRSICGRNQPVRLVITLGYAAPEDALREKKRKDPEKLITVLGE